jgi:pyridoxine 5-phosphate synthase
MRLYVNIDHVATLRQARRTDEPDPIRAAAAAERGGADGITVHLREDRRHIQDADLVGLLRTVRKVVNLELGAHPEIVKLATRLVPFQATLVPERRQEITTEGGLALHGGRRDTRVATAARRLTDAGMRVSLFIDPDRRTIDRAAALGVPAIELHTGVYARTWSRSGRALAILTRAAAHARAAGLAVHAGHGLTYVNVQPVARLADIEELNIGHSIVSHAVFWGMEEAVRRMRRLIDTAPSAVGHQPSAESTNESPES